MNATTSPAATPAVPAEAVLARLPLQIGTTSAWSAARSAAAMFPGLALVGVALWMLVHISSNDLRVIAVVGVAGGMLVVYSAGHLRGAVRTRASDVLLLGSGLAVDGGRLHGEQVPWSELTAPYAEIEEATVNRITIGSILMVVIGMLAESSVDATSKVKVWRLHIHRGGARRLIAETDRPIERDSMTAAATSVGAVVSGQRYVAEAPTVAARILTCGRCGAAAVPDDAPVVACAYCATDVPVPADIRGQAAATKAASATRGTTDAIIAKLRDQPRAAHANVWLLVLGLLMFGAWPLGWGLVGVRALADGFQASDLAVLLLPFAAVLAGFFLSRARLADRGALQLLTLGFGALAPARPGEPSRCRRCQGPLPGAGLGGVAHCRYCAAENIVGLDLRPTVDPARTERATFDVALAQRASEKRMWAALSVAAGVALTGWAIATVAYVVHIEEGARPAAHDAAKAHPKATPGKHAR